MSISFDSGNQIKACPYYATRAVYEADANYILAPYNYIIDAGIRKNLNIDLTGAVVVFDEAHNIEDVAREAASAEMSQSMLIACEGQLRRLAKTGSIPHRQLLDLVTKLLNWVTDMYEDSVKGSSASGGTQQGNDHINGSAFKKNGGGGGGWQQQLADSNIWEGPEILDIFEDRLGLTADTLQMYQAYYEQVVSQDDDMEAILAMLKGGGGGANDAADDGDESTTGTKKKSKRKKKVDLAYEVGDGEGQPQGDGEEGGEDGDEGEEEEDKSDGERSVGLNTSKTSTGGTPKKDKQLSVASFSVLKGETLSHVGLCWLSLMSL